MTDDAEMSMHESGTSISCACNPRLFRPCRVCDPEDLRGAALVHLSPAAARHDKGCWKCESGLIAVTHARAKTLRAAGVTIVVVHRAV